MNRKNLLFTPGPLQVSERVMQALYHGNIVHREEKFTELLVNLQQKLLSSLEVNEEYSVCLFNSTGRGANEAVIAPFARTRKLAIISNGSWGDNLLQIARKFEPSTRFLQCPNNKRIDPALVANFLDVHTYIDSIAVVHQETRTGILNPIKNIAEVAKARKVDLIVDAMSSIIVEETNFQNIDVAFFTCSSTKGLRSVPGIGIVCGKKDEFEKIKNHPSNSHYFDLFAEYESQNKDRRIRFAQSTPILVALHESVSELLEEGLESRKATIKERTSFFREWAIDKNIEIDGHIPELGNVITNFNLPPNVDYPSFASELKKYNIYLLYGEENRTDQFQVSFFGAFSGKDIEYLKEVILKILRK